MRLSSAWRSVVLAAALAAFATPAHAGDPLKPYVFLVLDTSGSMSNSTGYGPPSCPGSIDTRIDHAKCAINNIASSFGDMVLGVARFRQTSTDTNPANGCTVSSSCPADATIDSAAEVIVGLFDGNNSDLVRWTDFTAGTCTSLDVALNPEITAASGTPIAGALAGTKRYWQGLQSTSGATIWAAGSPGFDPIRNDPTRNVFLPSGRQCRPYIVISMTDGDESCGDNVTTAAASLLTTTVDARNYRIETKAIGFGTTPGDPQIEAIAHAGGATNGDGNEGLYVTNEEELQVAISNILSEAVKFELCNNADDDCDVLVDEDFPDKNAACNDGMFGRCRGTGVRVCNGVGSGTVCQITTPGGSPITETCNNLDDDCDNRVDENLMCACGDVELCNNMDDDCDSRVDENLVRDCGTDVGVCVRGTETCSAGAWAGCTAVGPMPPEACNGLDDDCDGIADGLSRACSNLPGGNPNVGRCHPGTQVCPPGGSGTWGMCLGEVGPAVEACDTIDNDCDGNVDEGTGGADCSSTCGVGQTVCLNGVISCQGATMGGMEICNDFDDDCDGNVDEGIADMGPCTMGPGGEPLCMPGVLRCVGGTFVCQGGEPAAPEACDCRDNDCDTRTDEEPPALCGGGATCTHCQCALPCASGEFPCPEGRVCVDDFCLIDRCFGVTCDPLPNGDRTVCDDGTCVRACDGLTCNPGFVCVGALGECRPDNCLTFPDRCSATEACVNGTCVADPCAGVDCPSGEYCQGGTCHGSCTGVTCPTGQRCILGECEVDPCGMPCRMGFVCNEQQGECVNDPCLGQPCPGGQACNPQNGQCEQDPCLGVECPNPGEVCDRGTCRTPMMVDGGVMSPPDLITAGGGGGCATGGGAGLGAALALLGLVVRRRRSVRTTRAGGGRS